jgi:hypothetical protein
MAENSVIRIDHTPDLAEAGVREVARALAFPARFPHLDSFEQMRQRVADNMVSLAFRRYLVEQGIPHQSLESASFTEPEQFDTSFGGRRCVLFAQMVCQRDLIQQVHQNPEVLLQGDVYLPEGGISAAYRDVDLYLFVYLTALITPSRDEVDQAQLAGQPLYLVHQLPASWSLPRKWQPLGEMAYKTDTSENIWLELHGQDQHQAYHLQNLVLPPRKRVAVNHSFYTLGAVHTDQTPSGPVGLFSPALNETHLISPHQWGNIWVYGLNLFLAGYTTQAEFNRLSRRVEGSQVTRVNPCGQTVSFMSMPAAGLKSAADLFVRARNWDRQL